MQSIKKGRYWATLGLVIAATIAVCGSTAATAVEPLASKTAVSGAAVDRVVPASSAKENQKCNTNNANGELNRDKKEQKLTNDEINIRDTFILVHDCQYFLYGTRGESAFSPTMDGFDVYVSNDLKTWSGPTEVYHNDGSNWATRRYWAPEVHEIDGSFYMFTAWASATSRQTPTILKADNPLGPFTVYSGPFFMGSEGNDLTIYEEDGVTNVVLNFQSPGTGTPINPNGIYYVPINDDLTGFTNVPKLMFTSAGCAWCTMQPARFHDGAWLHKLSNGTLITLFSQTGAAGYSVGVVQSSNGRLDGTWTHQTDLLVTGGGHGMFFTSLEGKLMMAVHKDAAPRVTHPYFYEISEDLPNNTVRIVPGSEIH